MKNVFKIYKRDILKISTNWAALIMIIVLIFVPSLYSLINIKASWDPYGNTGGIKVAIINEDKGTTFKEKDINIGKELVEKLQQNDKLGWTFVDEETGKKGLLEEKYYATIEIPEDFSEDVTTLVDKNVTKPKLIYTVNEKKNAVAPKMTDSGVNTVKSEIDENIVKTVSGIMFRICNEAGVDIQNNRPELRTIIDAIYELDENMPELGGILNSAIDGTISASNLLGKANEMIPTVSDTIDATEEFLDNNQNFLDKAQGDLNDISPLIKDKLVASENVLDTSGVILGNLDENILPELAKKNLNVVSDSAKATQITIQNIKSKLENIKTFIDKISSIDIKNKQISENNSLITGKTDQLVNEATESANKQLKLLQNMQEALKDVSKRISEFIDRLDIIDDRLNVITQRVDNEIEKLDNGGKLDTQDITDIRKLLDDVHTLVSDILDDYDSKLVPTIEEGFNSIRKISDNGLTLLEQGRSTLPEVNNLLNSFTKTSDLSNEQLLKLRDKFPDVQDKVHKLADKLRNLDDEDQIDELLDMITNDWDAQSTFMASPVEIEDNRLFPWPNYGSTATPFYTVLCLWVGGLLASALLAIEAPEFEDGTKIKAYEMYLGKLLVFLSLGVFQAMVASIGALYILGSYAVHPIMYIFYSIFVSIVFVTIIFTAASILDDVGKAIIVIILVLQIAGTGGNFPIEVTPVFFQKIYPYLPFTYATNGMRQILAGIVYNILFKDMAILFIYMVISLIFGILFKDIINKTTGKMMKKLATSEILRH